MDIVLKKDSGLKIEFELCELSIVNCQYYEKCQILPKKSFKVPSRQTKIGSSRAQGRGAVSKWTVAPVPMSERTCAAQDEVDPGPSSHPVQLSTTRRALINITGLEEPLLAFSAGCLYVKRRHLEWISFNPKKYEVVMAFWTCPCGRFILMGGDKPDIPQIISCQQTAYKCNRTLSVECQSPSNTFVVPKLFIRIFNLVKIYRLRPRICLSTDAAFLYFQFKWLVERR